MRLTITEIAEAANGTLRYPHGVSLRTSGSSHHLATGLSWDSRTATPGCLYACLAGERADGHDFAAAAVDAGAVAVLALRELDLDVPVIVVDDVQKAIVDLARYWRARLNGTVIGLTGSVGKTTTKNLVRSVLSAAGTVVATKANQNNELGVPATLLSAEEDTDFVVVEMGMRGLGQIAQLCLIARPDWGIVTNAGQSHIELLGSRENIARAKSELYKALPHSGIAFVNAADDFASEMVRQARLVDRGVQLAFFEGGNAFAHVAEMGIFQNEDPFVWASDVVLDGRGCPSFTVHASELPDEYAENACTLALPGAHNVSNACAAIAVGMTAGLTLGQCCEALAEAQPEKGRVQVLCASGNITIIDDSYNANPDSTAASLATFAAMQVKGRRIAVLGDMLELGDYAEEGHERIGKLAQQLGVDRLICVGELSRAMAQAALSAGMPAEAVQACDTADEALEIVRRIVKDDCAVLVKASHSIGLHTVVEGLVD